MKYYSCWTWHLCYHLISFLKNKAAATCHRSSFLHMKEAIWRSINLFPVSSLILLLLSAFRFLILEDLTPQLSILCVQLTPPVPHRITDLMLPLWNQPYVFTSVSYCSELGITVSSAPTHTYRTLPTIFIPAFFHNYFSSIARRELRGTLEYILFLYWLWINQQLRGCWYFAYTLDHALVRELFSQYHWSLHPGVTQETVTTKSSH